MAKIALGGLLVALVIAGGAYLHNTATEVGETAASSASPKFKPPSRHTQRLRTLQVEKNKLAKQAQKIAPATAGSNGSSGSVNQTGSGFLKGNARAAFASLEQETPAAIGVAVAPFGSVPPTQIGALENGHAWSTFKVPIVVTLMRRGTLSAEEQAQARAAITASDNSAAAALFSKLGSTTTASAAVESVLAQSGYPTPVATAPPPPGAVSTWGQTDWSLSNSAGFYRALACGQLLGGQSTAYVVSLMEEVIPEQQWGLGEAGIPGTAAFKGGWGPDGSASGPYLVRQTGILRSGSSGAVVTIAAQDDSGSFEAGIRDLDAVAAWVRDNVRLTAGSCGK